MEERLANLAFPVNTRTQKERKTAKFALRVVIRGFQTLSVVERLAKATSRTLTEQLRCPVKRDRTLSERETLNVPDAIPEQWRIRWEWNIAKFAKPERTQRIADLRNVLLALRVPTTPPRSKLLAKCVPLDFSKIVLVRQRAIIAT